jgi:hypothetical protein
MHDIRDVALQIVARQREGHRRLQEPRLGAAIEALPLKAVAIDLLAIVTRRVDGIGQLDLTTRARLFLLSFCNTVGVRI